MGRLIRLDRSGHTTLAEWTAGGSGEEAAAEALRRELELGMIASATAADGTAEVVRELPLDAELVILRRPIAGG
jgi:20S proteasome alpha/beta subunit